MSRLHSRTGAWHRRGRARQTRPMRSRRPPCHSWQQKIRRALFPKEVQPKERRTKLAITPRA